MATVTGKTSAKIDELLGQTLVGGELNAEGALVFTRKNGATINAGSLGTSVVSAVVNGAKRLILTKKDGSTVDAGSVATAPYEAWPVGSIYMSAVSTSPATLLGGGTWQRWGQGRVPVSLDSTQSEFDAVEETGGEKTTTLTADNLPAHKHPMPHTHTIAHTHEPPDPADVWLVNDVTAGDNRASGSNWNSKGVGVTGQPNPNVSGQPSVPDTGDNASAHTPVSNLQPYITCYMWKRTA